MKRIAWCMGILVLCAPVSGATGWDLPGSDAPLPPPQAGEFDPEFLATVNSPFFGHGLRLSPESIKMLRALITVPQPDASGKKDVPDEFAFFLEILQYFIGFVNEFEPGKERGYASVGDFRAYYLRKVSDKVPFLYYQVESFRTTAQVDAYQYKVEGGGAGLRIELHPNEKGTFTVAVLPLYGERRSFSPRMGGLPGGSDLILRSTFGVAYRHKVTEYLEPGVHVQFQPQLVDPSQFRVYVEAFMRIRIRRDIDTVFSRISEVSVVPKFIYWHSTDREGLLGDPIRDRFGDAYRRFAENLYGFVNLEFQFRM